MSRIVTRAEQERLHEDDHYEVVMTCDECGKDVDMLAIFNAQSVEPMALCVNCLYEAYSGLRHAAYEYKLDK